MRRPLTDAEIDALDFELGTTFDTTLTEERFNELVDLLLPTLEGFPDAQGTLLGFGKKEWRERRFSRLKATKSAA
jgi:hypothetical protein